MIKYIVTTIMFILFATSSVYASDWKVASSAPGVYSYIDESSMVAISSDRVLAWSKYSGDSDPKSLISAKVARVIFDCKYNSTRIVYYISYDSNGKTKNIENISPENQTDDPLMPDSMGEEVHNFVCHKSAVAWFKRMPFR